MGQRIGTILHGALGDCYEQLLCLQKFKQANSGKTLVGFFAVENRQKAFSHFDLSVLDEIHSAEMLCKIPIDTYYQFQFFDPELQQKIISKLPEAEKAKFDSSQNILPWKTLQKHNFSEYPLTLNLSTKGNEYLNFIKEIHGINDVFLSNKLKIGFLWRYRGKGINSFGQYPKNIVKNNISSLLNCLIKEYNAHIIVCGMGRGLTSHKHFNTIVENGGIALGEFEDKFESEQLDITSSNITYLMGTGFAAEMEIMSECDLLITMPSGFSEPLWMRKRQPVIIIFPPFEYLLRLWKHKMPFFNHATLAGKWFNTFTFHSTNKVLSYIKKMNYLPFEK